MNPNITIIELQDNDIIIQHVPGKISASTEMTKAFHNNLATVAPDNISVITIPEEIKLSIIKIKKEEE